MQTAGVLTAGYDRMEGMPRRVVHLEDVFHLGLHLVFVTSRFYCIFAMQECLTGDVASLFNNLDLFFRLDLAKLIQNRSRALEGMQRILLFNLFHEAVLDGHYFRFETRVFVKVEINLRTAEYQLFKHIIEAIGVHHVLAA